jgi:hypothetical protein
MRHKICSVFVAALVLVASESRAADEALTPEGIIGTWVLGDGSCNDDTAEFVTFRGNGAVESSNGAKLQAAGFWRLADGLVKLDVIASPAFFEEKLKEMVGQYHAFEISLAPFNVKDSSFEAIGILGQEVRRTTFARCAG